MPEDLRDRYASTRTSLTRLLELGRPPKILEVLRTLKAEILSCHRNGVSQVHILQSLNENGFKISRTGFSYAYRMLLFEEGIIKTPVQTPTGPAPRVPRLIPPPRTPASAPTTANSTALRNLTRPTIKDLLSKGL